MIKFNRNNCECDHQFPKTFILEAFSRDKLLTLWIIVINEEVLVRELGKCFDRIIFVTCLEIQKSMIQLLL